MTATTPVDYSACHTCGSREVAFVNTLKQPVCRPCADKARERMLAAKPGDRLSLADVRTPLGGVKSARSGEDNAAGHAQAAVVSVPAVLSRPDGAWEPPTAIGRSRTLPAFPDDAFPPWLGDYVRALAEATQTPPDLAGMLALSTLAAIAGGLARVEVRPGWQEPVNLFTAVALAPGSRKSAVFADVTAPLTAFDREELERKRSEIIEAETSRKIAEGAALQAQAAAAKAPAANVAEMADEATRLAAKAAAILVPPMPRLLADDATPEALSTLLVEHGRIALMAPEGDVFDMMAGRYQSAGGPNLGVYLKGHAGDPIRVDRKGRGPEFAPAPALTVGLAVQPEVLRSIADRPGFRGRGLLARFLFSLPVNTVGARAIAAAPVPEEVRNRYRSEVRALARSLLNEAELAALCSDEDDDLLLLTLSPDAAAAVVAFETELEPRLAPEAGDLGHVADWSAKLAGAVVRMAGLLHLAEHLHDGWTAPVSASTMANAVTLGRYMAEHAVAVFELMGAAPEVERARVVLRWIERTGVTEFTKRDCFRAMPKGQFEKADALDPVLALLEDHGWVRPRPAPEPSAKGGRPPSPTYDVNPLRVVTEPPQLTQPPSAGGSVSSVSSVTTKPTHTKGTP